MGFVNRVKDILLKRNEEEIKGIDQKISELQDTHYQKAETVNKLKEESDVASKEKRDVQKNILNKKELAELEIIYDFVANHEQIDKAIETIRHITGMMDYIELDIVDGLQFIELDEELMHREKLSKCLQVLNQEISKILAGEQPTNYDFRNIEKKAETQIHIPAVKKRGLLARLLKKDKENTASEPKSEKKETAENLNRKPRKGFGKFRDTVKLFDMFYNSFIVVDIDGGPMVIDKTTANIIMANIKGIFTMEKRGTELVQEDYMYLDGVRPHELWKEISRYYSQTLELNRIVQNFSRHMDNFEKLYKSKPELFDVKNLEQIFKDNNQRVSTLREKNKTASEKSGEVLKSRQEEKEIRAQIKALEAKKAQLVAKNKKIIDSKSIKELGYKNKIEAFQKLGIESKDYIVIPVPKSVTKIKDIFEEEKRLKIDIDGNSHYAVYTNDVAIGRINTCEDVASYDSVLLIPIASLKKDDIDNVRTGKIALNPLVLKDRKALLLTPAARKMDLSETDVEVMEYTYDALPRHLSEFLGEDYTDVLDETESFDIFKGIPNVSSKEKKLRKEAVKECVLENIKYTVTQSDVILVNGKTFFINKEDENYIRQESTIKPLNEKLLGQISSEIEEYIIYDGKNSLKLDQFYKRLLTEYLRVNRKTKAEYYEEDDTVVEINGRKINMKPTLPAKNDVIAKRYARSKEDIAYKAMKLAMIINKFAHLTDNEKLQEELYDVKLELIEHAIDLAKNNPNVNIKQVFDKDKMVMSVLMETPGYNMIALHAKNKGSSLSYKANRLDVHEGFVTQSSTILMPGLNRNLLMQMKAMDEEERGRFLIDLKPEVFYKLAIRMGYTSDRIGSAEDRTRFIKKMTTDKKLDELLKQTDELEK